MKDRLIRDYGNTWLMLVRSLVLEIAGMFGVLFYMKTHESGMQWFARPTQDGNVIDSTPS